MLYLSLVAFVAVRVAAVLLGPAAAAVLVFDALATRRVGFAVAAVAALALGLVPPHRDPPTGVPGTLSGTVVAVEAPPDEPVRIKLAAPRFDGQAVADPLSVRFTVLDDVPAVGDAIAFEATLEQKRAYLDPSPFPPEPGPPHGIGLSVPRPDPRGVPWNVALAIGLRANLTFDDPTVTALHRALVLGDRTELPPELRWAYQDTGLAHLLAISGFNLAVLGWGLYRILRWLCLRLPRLAQGGRPSAWAAAVSLLFVAAYTLSIMPSDATDRAMIGLGLALGAFVLNRRARGWRTLSVCFLVALGIDPGALMRPSFQLTFAASAALLASGPTVRRWRAWLEEP